MSYSMKQITRYLDVTSTTLRANWIPEFAEFLTDSANPPKKGQERRFTAEDVAVLATVAVLRQQGVEFAAIHERLAAGERLEPVKGERPSPAEDDEGETTVVAVAAFERALSSYEARVEKLEEKLDAAQTARLDAEIRAARLEGELTTLRATLDAAQTTPTTSTPTPPSSPPTLAEALRSWWAGRKG